MILFVGLGRNPQIAVYRNGICHILNLVDLSYSAAAFDLPDDTIIQLANDFDFQFFCSSELI